jgi:cell division protein FtsL
MAGDTARLRGRFSQAPKGNKLIIIASVVVALGVSAMPLMNKKVYDTEQKMAALRDGQYVDPMEAKNEARNQRLQGPTFRKKE